jgi:hypothetical protein
MSAADEAYRAAEAAIAKAKAEGAERLSFFSDEFHALERIPQQIAGMTNLSSLSFDSTQITDLKPLAGLHGLERLFLSKTLISELAPLSGLTDLAELFLDSTLITDISPLVGLAGLRELFLDDTQITDFEPLAQLKELRTLSLDNTKITDLRPLANLGSLHGLNLDNTNTFNLEPLKSLRSLIGLSLSRTQISNLAPLAGLRALQDLSMEETLITDLASLVGLTNLAVLSVDGCKIEDMRSIAKLEKLGSSGPPGLTFLYTSATERDKRLAELAKIEDHEERTRETLAYLRTLPPWPEPYTPAATPDGSPPQPIGTVVPKVQTAKAQIQSLVRNALVTRISAQNFAAQIEDALRDVPATNGNNLAEPLQTMLEFAEVLRNLAPETTPVTDPLDRAHLELRIAQLEALVSRLSGQLSDETKRREAAEALSKKDGFIATHNKSFATEAGKWNARIIYIGVPSAAIYFLGAENALVATLSKVLTGVLK